MIPRELIYNKDIGDNRIIIYTYLCCNRTFSNTVAFSINNLAYWQNKKPDRHKGRINDKNRQCLSDIGNLGYFTCCPDLDGISNMDNFYSIDIDTGKFDNPNYFGIIYYDEIENLLNFKELINDENITNRVNSDYLFTLLSYLRSNISHRKTGQSIEKNPECCYRLYDTICSDTGLYIRIIPKLVKILELLGIIKIKECGRYQDDKKVWHTGYKIFANTRRHVLRNEKLILDENYNCDFEIEMQIKLLKEKEKKKNDGKRN